MSDHSGWTTFAKAAVCYLTEHVEWKVIDGGRQKCVHGQCWRCGVHVFEDEMEHGFRIPITEGTE